MKTNGAHYHILLAIGLYNLITALPRLDSQYAKTNTLIAQKVTVNSIKSDNSVHYGQHTYSPWVMLNDSLLIV